MKEQILFALDAGTTGIKGGVFTPDGRCILQGWRETRTFYPKPGYAEQDPKAQWESAVELLRELREKTEDCEPLALVFTGTMNGCIPIDRDGEALYPNIIHADTRTTREVAAMEKIVPGKEFYARTGNLLNSHISLPKYRWLRQQEPGVYDAAWRFVNIKDYLYGRMTGQYGCTDRSDASLCGVLDIQQGTYAEDLLQTLEVDAGKMPELRSSADVTGRVSREAAALTGLPEGLPTAIGGGDGSCAARGTSCGQESYLCLGSSAWVSQRRSKPVTDSGTGLFQYYDLDGQHLNLVGTVQSATAASNWIFSELFFPGKPRKEWDFKQLEALARSVPAGADGLFFLPTLMGERTPWWDDTLTGSLLGMTFRHTRAHVVRAVYEGVMQSLAQCGKIMSETGVPVRELVLSGGGAASELWLQMAASMFGCPVSRHAVPDEATGLGAAMAALVGIGYYADFDAAACMIRRGKTVLPDPEETAIYAVHAETYRRLVPEMKKAFQDVAQCQTKMAAVSGQQQ